ncbi:MAG: nickel pincer cofactor biosynthesis protein LarC [Lentimonas sp.]
MPTLVYQCPAGLSGDMNLGAMVALGVDPNVLESELRKLPYEGWSLKFEKDIRQGISGTRCDVVLEAKEHSRDHSHSHKHDHDHSHKHDHSHDHSHSHHHSHSEGHHHRTFSDIRSAIENSELSDQVKRDAVACFRALAEAEGAVHGIDPETVHFHEVGAVDSIVDMVGAAVCWDLLNIDRVVCTTLEVGGGTVQCAHGRMPVPAPATARLLEGKPFTAGGTNKETTTPTGASLLVGKSAEFGARTYGKQVKTGIGIGQRDDPKLANAVYVSLIDETSSSNESESVYELATNIDDMPAESIAHLCEQLLKAGALDVWQTAATFKKGRQGCVVHTLVEATFSGPVESAYFKHSNTLGVRRQVWQRSKLKREFQILSTEWGEVSVKIAHLPDGSRRHKFEYEDCVRIASETGLSLDAVRAKLERALS